MAAVLKVTKDGKNCCGSKSKKKRGNGGSAVRPTKKPIPGNLTSLSPAPRNLLSRNPLPGSKFKRIVTKMQNNSCIFVFFVG